MPASSMERADELTVLESDRRAHGHRSFASGDIELPLALELLAERLATNERKGVPQEAVALARVERREDVRMVQAREAEILAIVEGKFA